MSKHRQLAETATASSFNSNFHERSKLRLVPPCVHIDGENLTVDDVVLVSKGAKVVLTPQARQRIRCARRVLQSAADGGQQIYGMNTQLGPYVKWEVLQEQLEQFQMMTVIGHSVPIGAEFDTATVRSMMLARINGFAVGTSGIRLSTAEAMIALLNSYVHPIVRSGCSVGESDLSEMAQIAMVLVGFGQAEYRGTRMTGAEALAAAGLEPIKLAGKEGLALISANGLTVGQGALVLAKAAAAMEALNRSAAMSLEGFGANLSILHPAVARVKAHPGHVATSAKLRDLLRDSYLWKKGAARNIQDPLSFRCIAHVHGALYESIANLRASLEIELNSGSDNPMVSIEDECVMSCGNFDVTNIAMGFDTVRIALIQSINMANERIQKMVWQKFSGLPTGLEKQNDGLTRMIPVARAAAALNAEAKTFAAAASLMFSGQIAEGIEDFASSAPLTIKQTETLLQLCLRVSALEMLVAAAAIALRDPKLQLGVSSKRTYEFIFADQALLNATNWVHHLERLEHQLLSSGPK